MLYDPIAPGYVPKGDRQALFTFRQSKENPARRARLFEAAFRDITNSYVSTLPHYKRAHQGQKHRSYLQYRISFRASLYCVLDVTSTFLLLGA